MKTLVGRASFAVALSVAVTMSALAQQTGDAQSLSYEFEQRLIEVTEAVRTGDASVLDLMVPRDFLFTRSRDGFVFEAPRRTWLRFNTKLRSYDYEHVRARQLNGTTVVTSIYMEQMDVPDTPARYLVTDVWVRDGPVWVLVSRSQAALGEFR